MQRFNQVIWSQQPHTIKQFKCILFVLFVTCVTTKYILSCHLASWSPFIIFSVVRKQRKKKRNTYKKDKLSFMCSSHTKHTHTFFYCMHTREHTTTFLHTTAFITRMRAHPRPNGVAQFFEYHKQGQSLSAVGIVCFYQQPQGWLHFFHAIHSSHLSFLLTFVSVTISSVTTNIYIQNVFEPLHDIFTPCKPAIFHQANGLIEVSRFFFMFCVSLFVCSIYFLSSSYFVGMRKIFFRKISDYFGFFQKPSENIDNSSENHRFYSFFLE